MIDSVKIPLHSITDLITNSSTVIYTYSDASPKACEDMINEIFAAFGIDKKCEDVFYLSVSLKDADYYSNYLDSVSDEDEDEDEDNETEITKLQALGYSEKGAAIEKLLTEVIEGKIEKPDWMKAAEEFEDGDGYRYPTVLNIIPKSPQHKKLADLIRKFLYSTDNEATYG